MAVLLTFLGLFGCGRDDGSGEGVVALARPLVSLGIEMDPAGYPGGICIDGVACVIGPSRGFELAPATYTLSAPASRGSAQSAHIARVTVNADGSLTDPDSGPLARHFLINSPNLTAKTETVTIDMKGYPGVLGLGNDYLHTAHNTIRLLVGRKYDLHEAYVGVALSNQGYGLTVNETGTDLELDADLDRYFTHAGMVLAARTTQPVKFNMSGYKGIFAIANDFIHQAHDTVRLLVGRKYDVQAWYTTGIEVPGVSLSRQGKGLTVNADGTALELDPDTSGYFTYTDEDPAGPGGLTLTAITVPVTVQMNGYRGLIVTGHDYLHAANQTVPMLVGRRYEVQAWYSGGSDPSGVGLSRAPYGLTISETGTSLSLDADLGRYFTIPNEGAEPTGLTIRARTVPVTIDMKGYPGFVGLANWFFYEGHNTIHVLAGRRYQLDAWYTNGIDRPGMVVSRDPHGVSVGFDGTIEVDADTAVSLGVSTTAALKVTKVVIDPNGYPGSLCVLGVCTTPGASREFNLMTGRRYDLPGAGQFDVIDSQTCSPSSLPIGGFNVQIRCATVAKNLSAEGAPIALITNPTGLGGPIGVIRDGIMPVVGTTATSAQYDTYQGGGARAEDWVGYQFAENKSFSKVVFQEGMHFDGEGGWFDSLTVQVRRGGAWVPVSNLVTTPPYTRGAASSHFETYQLAFDPVVGDAIRIHGTPGGPERFVSVGELRVYGVDHIAADAGPDQIVAAGELVQLDGQRSTESETAPLTYAWTQTAGTAVSLSGATTARPTFVAPATTTPVELSFSLAVARGGVAGATDAVTVLVLPPGLKAVVGMGVTVAGAPGAPGGDPNQIDVIRDGDMPLAGTSDPTRQYQSASDPGRTEDSIGFEYATTRAFSRVIFQEGLNSAQGGFFETLGIQVRQGGNWVDVPNVQSNPPYPFTNNGMSYERYTLSFAGIAGDAIRLRGRPGGTGRFLSVGELQVLAAELPRASAGQDFALTGGNPATLDGAESHSPTGQPLAFTWTQIGGPQVTLDGASTSGPTFTAPVVARATDLVFSLTVADGLATSSPDTVTITALPAGELDVTGDGTIIASVVKPGIEVIRDSNQPPVGSGDVAGQYDTNTGAPARAEDWIGYQYLSNRSFSRVAFQEGLHVAQGGWFETLKVQVHQENGWVDVPNLGPSPPYPGANNGTTYERYRLDFDPIQGDAIRIHGRPGGTTPFISVAELRVFTAARPQAYAGVDQMVTTGAAVTLDGSGSWSPSGNQVTFLWTQVSGATAALVGETTAQPTFLAPAVARATDLVFSLVVSDGGTNSFADTVTVTVGRPGEVDVTDFGQAFALVDTPIVGGPFSSIRDGKMPPVGDSSTTDQYSSHTGHSTRDEDWVRYEFASNHSFSRLMFQEGLQSAAGGWFETLDVQVRQGSTWVDVSNLDRDGYPMANNGISYQRYRLGFDPISGNAIRLRGRPGGSSPSISVGELRALAAPIGPAPTGELLVRVARHAGGWAAGSSVVVTGWPRGVWREAVTDSQGEARFTVPLGHSYNVNAEWFGLDYLSPLPRECTDTGCDPVTIVVHDVEVTVSHNGGRAVTPLPELVAIDGAGQRRAVRTQTAPDGSAIGRVGVRLQQAGGSWVPVAFLVRARWLGMNYDSATLQNEPSAVIRVADTLVKVEAPDWAPPPAGLVVSAIPQTLRSATALSEGATDAKGEARIAVPINQVVGMPTSQLVEFRAQSGGITAFGDPGVPPCDPSLTPVCPKVRLVLNNPPAVGCEVRNSSAETQDLVYRKNWSEGEVEGARCDLDRARQYMTDLGMKGWENLGGNTPCDVNQPAGRIVSAAAFLDLFQNQFRGVAFSNAGWKLVTYDPPARSPLFKDSLPARAYRVAAGTFELVKPECTDDTQWAEVLPIDPRFSPNGVTLRFETTFRRLLFEAPLPMRAAALVHESRHHQFKTHLPDDACWTGFFHFGPIGFACVTGFVLNAEDARCGDENERIAGEGCDHHFGPRDNCQQAYADDSGYSYEAKYLWDWYVGCQDQCTPPQRQAARAHAAELLRTRFVVPPGILLPVVPEFPPIGSPGVVP